jgi:hypothetical protein
MRTGGEVFMAGPFPRVPPAAAPLGRPPLAGELDFESFFEDEPDSEAAPLFVLGSAFLEPGTLFWASSERNPARARTHAAR